ncbi:FKBP-type peptidyl-prolyl cis-trans isomerase [Actinokineospora bangkokensis]|uniref:Peptidyl-prolyl cis-trans isomerase n=1 Tax=Actinokineospora bangkokensis TaxID=1193682 RepID=A0A1Q9LRX4_9PSEU|nr:FKBP-type peptidyl-prolyl cis-trans isomerase [Actinokineospora bangkokensis]OLR94785.1 hypothetical protein BJP25_13200 [Actinokineospora bangkokensis]
MRTLGTALTAVALVGGLAACGNSEQASAGSPAGPTIGTSSTAAATSTSALPACTADDIKVDGAAGSKPTITVPDTCSPPKALLSKDLVPGSGKEVVAGSTVDTHYDLVTWSDKKELDSSWSRGETFPLENVGQAAVIEGWNEGVVGMKQGGRRLLVIPPDKGYGKGGNGIAPNETLVFVVDAVTVR